MSWFVLKPWRKWNTFYHHNYIIITTKAKLFMFWSVFIRKWHQIVTNIHKSYQIDVYMDPINKSTCSGVIWQKLITNCLRYWSSSRNAHSFLNNFANLLKIALLNCVMHHINNRLIIPNNAHVYTLWHRFPPAAAFPAAPDQ